MNKRTLLAVFAMLCLNVNASEQINKKTLASFKEKAENSSNCFKVKMEIVDNPGNQHVLICATARGSQEAIDNFCKHLESKLPEMWNLFIEKNKDHLLVSRDLSIRASNKKLFEAMKNLRLKSSDG